MKIWRLPLLALLSFYQKFISPLFGNSCRFYPSCSHYAKIAVTNLPLYKSIFIIVWRILRCNPYAKGGFDYVKGVDLKLQQPEAECSSHKH